jgi:predicted nucleic acid-binding protein
MSLVIDAPVTVAWYFEDETTAATEAILDKVSEAGATVPTLWRLEVANAFQSAIRRSRITGPYRDQSLAELTQLPITIDPDTSIYAWTATLRLAERFALTIYDSSYLELAQRRGLPLATLDTELREAAATLGVTLLGDRSDIAWRPNS